MFRLLTFVGCAYCITVSKFDLEKAKNRFNNAKTWVDDKKDSFISDCKDIKETWEEGDIKKTIDKIKDFTQDTIVDTKEAVEWLKETHEELEISLDELITAKERIEEKIEEAKQAQEVLNEKKKEMDEFFGDKKNDKKK